MPATQARATRLTSTAQAAGVIDWLNRASLRLRFNRGEVDPRILSGAATMGWLFDSQGTLRARPHNLISNSTMQGAQVGQRGVLPTGWSGSATLSGLARDVTQLGITEDYAFIDLRIYGTATANISGAILFECAGNAVSAVAGNRVAGRVLYSLVGGTFNNVGSFNLQLTGRASNSALSEAQTTTLLNLAGGNLQERIVDRVLVGATTTYVQLDTRISVSSGAEVDFTLRIAAPQLNLGELQPYYPTTGSPYFGPRLTYDPADLSAPPGLLAEEARTNSIRNSTMQGASAGTPGTLPTNWASGIANGITLQVVGTGKEQGIDYVDLRFFGTAAGTSINFRSEANNSVTASNGQTWTHSAFIRHVNDVGSASPTGTILILRGYSSTGSLLETYTQVYNPSAPSLGVSRVSQTRTLSNASAAFVRGEYQVGVTPGNDYDFTIRIGLPQLELGASASSPIPTFGAAATRAADNLSMTDMSWYQQSGGVLYVEGAKPHFPATQTMLQIDAGSNTNRVAFQTTSSRQIRFLIVSGGVDQTLLEPAVQQSDGVYFKAALIARTDYARGSINGSLSSVDNTLNLPTAMSRLLIGSPISAGGSVLIREIAFIPNANISDRALQALTA